MNWICSQIGAREHFAIPRALRRAGRTVTLCTDFWAGPILRQLAAGKLRSMAARCHPDLVDDPTITIRSWNLKLLPWQKLLGRKSISAGPYGEFIEIGRRFAETVRDELQHTPNLTSNSIFFAYDTGALETLTWCRDQNIKCILNQMDPSRLEMETVRAEERAWLGWALSPIEIPEEYLARREQEWALADRIVVNSEFCRQALLQQGVPAEKLVVIPLCYEAEAQKTGDGRWKRGDGRGEMEDAKMEDGKTALRSPSSSTLRVLFLGQVILRKGIHYLMEAARILEGENIQFDVVGPIGISAKPKAAAPRNLTFHGRTNRDEAGKWYERAHLFVLPTLSDGFAITQLEAMSHGLPVIATPCCGEVVTDGVDGFIVPARDPAELASALRRYLAQPDLLPTQSAAALAKAGQFTLDRLARNLVRLESVLED